MPSLYRKLGALEFPLADTGESDLASLDPPRDVLLELFAAAINDELRARWLAAVGGVPKLANRNPVHSKWPFDPSPHFLTQANCEFPSLFVYRDPDEPRRWEDFSLTQRKLTCRWGIDYFLGPLDIGGHGRLQDILHAVGAVVAEVIERGGHSAYATTTLPSGGEQRRLVLGSAGACGFSSIGVTEFRAGPASFSQGDGPKYLACTITLQTEELDGRVSTGSEADFDGTTVQLGTGDADGVIEDLADVRTEDAGGIWPDA